MKIRWQQMILAGIALGLGQWTAAQAASLDVVYVPTAPEVVNRMLEMAEVGPEDVVYDLGCGDGRIVISAVKDRGAKRGLGVDLDPERIAESQENAKKAEVTDRVVFEEKNLFDVELKEPTVIALYLLPRLNVQLRPKIFAEAKPGTRVVSHAFDMGRWEPDAADEIVLEHDHKIFFWKVPANVSGEWKLQAGKKEWTVTVEQVFQQIHAVAVAGGQQEKLKEAKLDGTEISFELPGEEGRFVGTVDGDTMKGRIEGESGRSVTWEAKRTEGTAQDIVPEESNSPLWDVQPAESLFH